MTTNRSTRSTTPTTGTPTPRPAANAWPLATALRESFGAGYGAAAFRGDLLAGLTVGIIAVPLAMALAIASGVPPQHGLYTSIVAGALIAIFGGTRLSVAGPTAAFVVILRPIALQHGLGGLLVVTVLAGLILIALGVARMGRLIEFIPYPVTTGFTAGIAVVIATIQIKDFLALDVAALPQHYVDKLATIFVALPTTHLPDVVIGVVTLAILVVWPRLRINVPGHLVALAVGTLLAVIATRMVDGFQVATIGSRFSYPTETGPQPGIPPWPPAFALPWHFPGAGGQPLVLSFDLVRELLPPAFTVAMLGAIESLLCAVVTDGMARTRHDPNAELIGQGLGNVVAPFFGGITATGAVARSAANVRAGARSPLAAVIHALTVLVVVLIFGSFMAYIPMAALAALLLMVAWNMSEAKHFFHVIRVAPRSDTVVLLICFGLTVLFDMVLAVGMGVVLAALLFMRRMAGLTGVSLVTDSSVLPKLRCPEQISVYRINGPLFFGAAERAMSTLRSLDAKLRVIVVDMATVPSIDMTAIVALDSMISTLERAGVAVIINGLPPDVRRRIDKALIARGKQRLVFTATLDEGLARAGELCDAGA